MQVFCNYANRRGRSLKNSSFFFSSFSFFFIRFSRDANSIPKLYEVTLDFLILKWIFNGFFFLKGILKKGTGNFRIPRVRNLPDEKENANGL